MKDVSYLDTAFPSNRNEPKAKQKRRIKCPGSKMKEVFSLLVHFVQIAQNQLVVTKSSPYNTGNLD